MSSYPLPPISTLSAALDPDTMQIAPELMGEEGLPDIPPSDDRRTSDFETGQQSYGSGFASSAARDEGGRHWPSAYAGNGRSRNPWEDGYRDDKMIASAEEEQQNDDTESAKPRKRSRVSRPRASRDKEAMNELLDDSRELEYEDPSHDPKRGAVFTHPPAGAAQACVRCHRIKRKCDNARPRCAGCSKADVPCVFELSPATSQYVHHLKGENIGLTAQIATAQERISHLETVITSLEQGLPPPQSSAIGGSDPADTSNTDFTALARTILSIRSSALAPTFGPMSSDNNQNDPKDYTSSASLAHRLVNRPLPAYQTASKAVETFFIANAISYPFLDKSEFCRDMDALYAERASAPSTWNKDQGADDDSRRKEFVMFMVIAIGTTNLERMGEVERGASKEFKERALAGLQYAVRKEDMLCVQSLLLLAIYSMFDPSGTPLWHVVGFAARVAISLNMHRRVDDASVAPAVMERRRRVFYSLYNLDRLVATTLSRPLAISDDDIDVEVPSGLASDSPYRGVPRILFTQHIIKLRRLSGAILSTVYSVSGSQNSLPESERVDIINDLHSQLDTWLAESPVPPPEEEEKRGMINSHSWFLLNYHHCLCLLYRPSPLYPTTTTERLRALHESSSRCVDLYLELWHEQKVSYNIINVFCQFLDCISLLYCLCEYDNRSPSLSSDPNWRREVSNRVGQCQELLEAFGRALPETAKYREIFGQLSTMLLSRHASMTTTATTTPMAKNNQDPYQFTIPSNSSGLDAFNLSTIPLSSPVTQNAGTGQDGGEAAYNAMTQLWHNAADFQFDDSFLDQIFNQRSTDGDSKGQNGSADGVLGQNQTSGAGLNSSDSGDGWTVDMLWNQLG